MGYAIPVGPMYRGRISHPDGREVVIGPWGKSNTAATHLDNYRKHFSTEQGWRLELQVCYPEWKTIK